MRATTGAGAVHGVPVHRFPSPLRRLVSLLGVVALLIAAPALAEKRVALVIGNAAYKHAPALANPKNDAEAMAAALKALNFEVLLGLDLDKPGMERLLQGFAEKLEKADVALVFYAGHGLMVNGANYLVPVDGKLERESDLLFQAIPADTVQRLLEQAQRVNIIILDACRDNPLARSLARSMGTRSNAVGRGLAPMTAGIGTLIVYATAPGHQALDGDGKNSPFTAALLKHIATPKVEIRDVFTRVRQEVFEATKARPQPQIPWDTSSLMTSFYLAAAPEARPPSLAPTPPPATDNETLFWQSIKDSKNAADYKAYLEKYPNGTFASLAKLRIAEIEKSASVTPPAPSPPEKPAPQPAPSSPKRTSSFDVGIANEDGTGQWWPSANDVRTCQATCINNPSCVGWNFYHKGGSFPCWLSRTIGKRVPQPNVTSGVIRTTPAAAPAQPAAPKPPTKTDTAAPADQQPLVRELMRKGQAREAENGFCTKLTWPLRNVWSNSEFVPLVPASGGIVLTKIADFGQLSSCSVRRISGIANEGGQKTRTMEVWGCLSGGRCFAQRLKMIERNGVWEHQQ